MLWKMVWWRYVITLSVEEGDNEEEETVGDHDPRDKCDDEK